MSLTALIRKSVEGHSLEEAEAYAAACALMDGDASPAQIAALLVALRRNGEMPAEVTGFARAMRERVVAVRPQSAPLLDLCGTGGSPCRVFNVSTAAAFVVASFGIPVAKHGNRAQSGVCGSADVLEALGVRLDLSPEQIAACIDTVGIGFLFAQAHHPAMKHVAPVRRELGFRTIFNLLGPLTNPAGATRQLLGIYESQRAELMCQTLKSLGTERAFVVHGEPGLDEVSTLGETEFHSLRNGEISARRFVPSDFGVIHCGDAAVLAPAATPLENAALLREVLAPETSPHSAAQARRDLVCVNVAAALMLSEKGENFPDLTRQAQEQILSGKPLQVLNSLVKLTQHFSEQK